MNKEKYILIGVAVFLLLSIFLAIFLIKNKKIKPEPINETPYAYFVDSLIELKIGETFQTDIAMSDETDLNIEFVYSSSDENVAIIDNKGLITALENGLAVITAKYDNNEINMEVFVPKEIAIVDDPTIAVTKVDIKEEKLSLVSGEKYQLNTLVYPSNATDRSLNYETNDSRVAVVNDQGLIIGKAQGTALITVYSNNEKTDAVEVKVQAPKVVLDSIEIMPNNITIVESEIYQLKGVLIPSNALSTVTWTSSDNSIVAVNNNGQITGKKVGTATITIRSEVMSSTAQVTVIPRTSTSIHVLSITLAQSSINIEAGKSEKIAYSINPSNATNKSLIWSSSNTGVAIVDANGVVTAISKGNTIITAKSINNKTATITVNVTVSSTSPGSPGTSSAKEIILNFNDFTIIKGSTKQLKATVLPLSASQAVTWLISDSSVVTVDNNGLLTAHKIGEAMVTAVTANGVIAKTKVIVKSKPLDFSKKAIYYGNGNIPEATISIINSHLNDYLEEAAYLANKTGKSVRKAKAIAAAYFLIYNPYYRIPYGYGHLSKYNVIGFNPKWSNTVGVECSGFVTWSLIQAGVPLGKSVQDYGARIVQTDANKYWTVDYILSIPGLETGDVLNKRYPRDENNNKLGNGHWALIVDINRSACTLTVAHATSVKAGLHLTTYKCGTTINYNRAFNTDKY